MEKQKQQQQKQQLWVQKEFNLPIQSRGCRYITEEVVQNLEEIKKYQIGTLHLFLKHTSASITLNENYDPDDLEDIISRIVPEDGNGKKYRHSSEGKDDMPAHAKCSLFGVSLTIPITNGKLNLGTWQGIWYCEHRDSKQQRQVVATIQGQSY